eukprot:CAMPEP_0197253722 /NCGR_PEP_ID=MMETSP1429-20130617/66070_1 /TAXON_ID=49237 /ORGANISM="Chaetoceros  sp., Strain UNC1202" /LENGTH=50 /DNA_ID=CAMNT_0042716491 /DNA_START=35 /DNA_END=183 /DNA_ORIENTATION=+
MRNKGVILWVLSTCNAFQPTVTIPKVIGVRAVLQDGKQLAATRTDTHVNL